MPLTFETWIAGKKAAVRYDGEVEAARKLAANLTAENEALRAQLQRVRRLCAQHDLLRAASVWDALDGGSDE